MSDVILGKETEKMEKTDFTLIQFEQSVTCWLTHTAGAVARDVIASINKLEKLGDAIAISKSETINHSLLTDPLNDRGSC